MFGRNGRILSWPGVLAAAFALLTHFPSSPAGPFSQAPAFGVIAGTDICSAFVNSNGKFQTVVTAIHPSCRHLGDAVEARPESHRRPNALTPFVVSIFEQILLLRPNHRRVIKREISRQLLHRR